jgi:hypothetical protein
MNLKPPRREVRKTSVTECLFVLLPIKYLINKTQILLGELRVEKYYFRPLR